MEEIKENEEIKEQEVTKPDLSVNGKTAEQQFSAESLPKSKDEWVALKNADPQKYMELTQVNFDKVYRQKRELEEKAAMLENQKNNLAIEVQAYKKRLESGELPPQSNPATPQASNSTDFPKTQEEWDNLAIDNPTLHADLRYEYNARIKEQQRRAAAEEVEKNTKFLSAREKQLKVLQEEHPELYIPELNSDGTEKRDDKGKVVLKRDSNGTPIFNPLSEKGKVWEEVARNRDYLFTAEDGVQTAQALLESELRRRGHSVISQSNPEREKTIREGQTIQDGVPAPSHVAVSFKNDEEKTHAEKAVQRGVYKDLTEYVRNRDSKDNGYYESNRIPNFLRK